MKVLLDTHTLIWATLSPHNLSRQASTIIANPANDILISSASAWEIATKVRRGKLAGAVALERRFVAAVHEAGYQLLSIDAGIALRAARLIGEHRDPFDRILAAHALALDIPIISTDSKLDEFGVRRLW